jgi:hypothetical protein
MEYLIMRSFRLILLFFVFLAPVACLPAQNTSAVWQQETDSTIQRAPQRNIQIKDIVIEENQKDHYRSSIAGRELLLQKEINRLPATLGETDVMQAVRLLPGVQSVSEGNSGVYVRGGSAGQNLFLLDEMELLNPSHLMGIYSVFNPLLTGQVEVYKGIAPVNLQGRLSSTIEVRSLMPDSTTIGTLIHIGNLSSSIGTIQQSKDGRFDFVVGYRRTTLEGLSWLASAFLSDNQNYFKSNDYSFYDFNGRIGANLSKCSKLTLAWYTGRDRFNFNDDLLNYHARTSWGNQSLSLQYRYIPNAFNTFQLSFAYNKTFSGFDGELIQNDLSLSSRFEQIQWKNQWKHQWKNHLFHFGLDFFGQRTMPVHMAMSYLSDTIAQHYSFQNIGAVAYIGDSYRFSSDQILLYVGMRMILNTALGPYTYGTVSYGRNEWIKTWCNVSPVISISYFPRIGYSYKASFSANDQNLHMAALSSVPLPNDLWISSSPMVHPETSQQLTLGFYRDAGSLDFSAEIYGKCMQHQLIFNVITDNSNSQGFEDQLFTGKGVAYGLDLSLRKRWGIYTGNIKYSFARSLRSFPLIMDGDWFNDKNDRPHDLNISMTCDLNKSWDFSALWTFASGNCMTLPAGRWWMMGMIMNDYNSYNGFRFPSYHRLDLSANWHLKTKHFKESVLNFSIINVYNRANPYYAYFKVYADQDQYHLQIKTFQISLFPILPSVSWQFKF